MASGNEIFVIDDPSVGSSQKHASELRRPYLSPLREARLSPKAYSTTFALDNATRRLGIDRLGLVMIGNNFSEGPGEEPSPTEGLNAIDILHSLGTKRINGGLYVPVTPFSEDGAANLEMLEHLDAIGHPAFAPDPAVLESGKLAIAGWVAETLPKLPLE